MKRTIFTLDGGKVSAPAGATILEAARGEGVQIPTLCHLDGYRSSGACLACVVFDREIERLVPACAVRVRDGMEIETSGAAVEEGRRKSLELLLSEHVGECRAPCERACPGGVDIPAMIRSIAAGRPAEALEIVRRRVALPAALSWVCAAPCERVCRRAGHDGPLSICHLKRYAAASPHADLSLPVPASPETILNVAVIGSGPAGLTAAWFLLRRGHRCSVFEKSAEAGGLLCTGEERPPREVLEAEVETVRRLGAGIITGREVGRNVGFDELDVGFDAVVVATGAVGRDRLDRMKELFGIQVGEVGVLADPHTFATSRERIFAAGSVIRPRRHPARAAAQGRDAALAVDLLLSSAGAKKKDRDFSSVLGSLREEEIGQLLAGSDPSPPVAPTRGGLYGEEEAVKEARRCMHCDCRKKEGCRLRARARETGAVQRHFPGKERAPMVRIWEHREVVFEPGKCIRCGLCLQTVSRDGTAGGLAFLERGIDMRVGTPFGIALDEALGASAVECATVCPTGAFSLTRVREGGKHP